MQFFSLHRALLLITAIPAGALSLAAPALAQAPAPTLQATTDTDMAVRNYWTPERIQSARNLDMHVTGMLRPGHVQAPSKVPRQIVHGGLPTVSYDESEAVRLPDEPEASPRADATLQARPDLVGSSKAPFTTNRLYPVRDTYKVFPYGAIGHLFFTTPSGNFQCSASVIRRSVIATAGHCVADGLGHYYTNWMFIPAQNGSLQPYGAWTWSRAQTTSSWWSGGGTVPNDQDDAVITLAQKTYSGKLQPLGNITGWFGYEYDAPLPTAITQVGYPCNLDRCSDPVATYTQVLSGPTNTYLFGTASFGGASGGPQVQDFGVAPSGVPSETLGGNIVVSSLSFTYTATGYDEDGASIFYAPGEHGEFTFGDLINSACAISGSC